MAVWIIKHSNRAFSSAIVVLLAVHGEVLRSSWITKGPHFRYILKSELKLMEMKVLTDTRHRAKSWLRRRTEKKPVPTLPPPRFVDVLAIVGAIVLSLFIGSYMYDRGLSEQITTEQSALHALKEQDATLKQEIAEANSANQLDLEEHSVPHPALGDRDTQIIGDHTNVSWEYPDQSSGKYVSFQLELVRLTAAASCRSSTERTPGCCSPVTDFLECKKGTARRFIASDSAIKTSRIPPDEHTLYPGSYAWRVAAVPPGTAVAEARDNDDIAQLSEWSAFGSFTLRRSILDRIRTTHHVRVGTNLEQNTQFSRRDGSGQLYGYDLSLVSALVEHCLYLTESEGLRYDSSRCKSYTQSKLQDGRFSVGDEHSAPCVVGESTLCVEFVPVRKWKDWQAALKRKEIDVFVGGVTAADARERGGIQFSRGYLNYDTRLYIHEADAASARMSLTTWLEKDRTVGVIEGSSNESLLDSIISFLSRGNKLLPESAEGRPAVRKALYSSFPALEEAMDRGEIDAVLIDETFVTHKEWIPLGNIRDSNISAAWDHYAAHFLGNRHVEQIAFAVAHDASSDSLTKALNSALSDVTISNVLLPSLCRTFWNSGPLCNRQRLP